MKIASLVLASSLFALPIQEAIAGLVGTDLSLSTLGQLTPTSQQFTSSFPRIARVDQTTVEFPDVSSLFNPNDPKPPTFGSLVNTWIDAGDNYIEIDFDSAGSGVFASAFQNTYIFLFSSQALATITGATINTSVTTLGLSQSDVQFAGNRLFVNVEGLPFNPASFARIDLVVEGGPPPVPEPGSLALLAIGVTTVLTLVKSKRS